MNLVICDTNRDICKIVNKEWRDIAVYNADIKDVSKYIKTSKSIAYISPTTMYFEMNNGINVAYSDMFNNIENKLCKKIKKYKSKTNIGYDYLPLGCAMITNVNPKTYLVSTPIRINLAPITERNIYVAFSVALCMIRKYNTYLPDKNKITTIITPIFGIGVGYFNVDILDSITQMKNVYKKYCVKIRKDYKPDEKEVFWGIKEREKIDLSKYDDFNVRWVKNIN